MSQQLKPPFGTLNIVDESSYESVTVNVRVTADTLLDESSYEPVTYNVGNVAVNISDSASTG
jgi:hypothetical protein